MVASCLNLGKIKLQDTFQIKRLKLFSSSKCVNRSKLPLGFFWRGSGDGGQRRTVFPPLEPAVVCSVLVHLDGGSELKSKQDRN